MHKFALGLNLICIVVFMVDAIICDKHVSIRLIVPISVFALLIGFIGIRMSGNQWAGNLLFVAAV